MRIHRQFADFNIHVNITKSTERKFLLVPKIDTKKIGLHIIDWNKKNKTLVRMRMRRGVLSVFRPYVFVIFRCRYIVLFE